MCLRTWLTDPNQELKIKVYISVLWIYRFSKLHIWLIICPLDTTHGYICGNWTYRLLLVIHSHATNGHVRRRGTCSVSVDLHSRVQGREKFTDKFLITAGVRHKTPLVKERHWKQGKDLSWGYLKTHKLFLFLGTEISTLCSWWGLAVFLRRSHRRPEARWSSKLVKRILSGLVISYLFILYVLCHTEHHLENPNSAYVLQLAFVIFRQRKGRS